MQDDDYSLLRRENIRMAARIEALESLIAKGKADSEPVHIDEKDLNTARPSLEDIASGKVVVKRDVPERRKPEADEIDLADQDAINQSIEQLATGEKRIVR